MLFYFPEKEMNALTIEIRATKGTKEVKLRYGNDIHTWSIKHELWDVQNPFFDFLDQKNLLYVKDRLISEKETAFDVFQKIRGMKKYPLNESADIIFKDGNVFSLEGKDLVDPGKFLVWYMVRYSKLLDMNREDWQSLISSLLKNADEGVIDPLAPPIVYQIIDIFKHSPVHDSFCRHIEENIENGGHTSWFVIDVNIDEETIFMPTSIAEDIRKREKLKGRALRQVLEPVLRTDVKESIIRRVGSHTARFWPLDLRKMYSIDHSVSIALETNLLRCSKEEVLNGRIAK